MNTGIHVRGYRFTFQSQESDDEISGGVKGAHLTAEFWEYDSRIARRWNIDPVEKEHESPYSSYANNPILFVDISGSDTTFYNGDDYDQQANDDFMTAYDNVNNRIELLQEEIKSYETQLSSGELNSRRTKKVEKNKAKAESNLVNWNKLKNDFDNIINNPDVLFHYTSNTTILDSDENGLTSGRIFRNEAGQIVGGDVNINIRPGHDESVIHENRHSNQILNGTNNRPVIERERDAFIYQRVYNYSSVEETIRNARIDKYGLEGVGMAPVWDLDDMINYLYGK